MKDLSVKSSMGSSHAREAERRTVVSAWTVEFVSVQNPSSSPVFTVKYRFKTKLCYMGTSNKLNVTIIARHHVERMKPTFHRIMT
ncbi:hypothetical protein TNCV_3172431 [Trichonephila clavipes]|nr:hypothetical protein TNCV_3172431 [Trichonephila clavipes]